MFLRAPQLTTGCYDSNGRKTYHKLEAQINFFRIWNHNVTKLINSFSFVNSRFQKTLKIA
jgi:hypothetical protein